MKPRESADLGVASTHTTYTSWRRALIYLPPVMLVVVALAQLTLRYTGDLVPWKGGGFGMFSSVDNEWNRVIRIFLIADGREHPIVRIPSSGALALQFARARALPTSDRLRRLIQTVNGITWSANAWRGASPITTSGAGRARVRPHAIRVEVYRLHYDTERRQLKRVQIREITESLR